jgi:hypothetical protein
MSPGRVDARKLIDELARGSDMEDLKRPTFWQVLASVTAAMFGVQSQRKRDFDFTHGRISDYVLVGLILMVLFVLMMMAVVQLVLHLAGG